jgi:hypothetical protein
MFLNVMLCDFCRQRHQEMLARRRSRELEYIIFVAMTVLPLGGEAVTIKGKSEI